MKKFERLPLEKRKEEIQLAALKLFNEKGFSSTTMENIVEQVSLSKGGVYRIYPSTSAILSDIMISGMRLRNAYYVQCVEGLTAAGKKPDLRELVKMVGDSLLLYPEISRVYAEFLWEKQRRPELQKLYEEICRESLDETLALIEKYGAGELLLKDKNLLNRLTEIMNGTVLSLHVLNLQNYYSENREKICTAICDILDL